MIFRAVRCFTIRTRSKERKRTDHKYTLFHVPRKPLLIDRQLSSKIDILRGQFKPACVPDDLFQSGNGFISPPRGEQTRVIRKRRSARESPTMFRFNWTVKSQIEIFDLRLKKVKFSSISEFDLERRGTFKEKLSPIWRQRDKKESKKEVGRIFFTDVITRRSV